MVRLSATVAAPYRSAVSTGSSATYRERNAPTKASPVPMGVVRLSFEGRLLDEAIGGTRQRPFRTLGQDHGFIVVPRLELVGEGSRIPLKTEDRAHVALRREQEVNVGEKLVIRLARNVLRPELTPVVEIEPRGRVGTRSSRVVSKSVSDSAGVIPVVKNTSAASIASIASSAGSAVVTEAPVRS